jgi:hypothetical protein
MIDHTALMDRVRHRVGDKRVLALVKAFLEAGVLTEGGNREDTHTGTPQGGILTPSTQWANLVRGHLVGVTVCGLRGGVVLCCGWGWSGG